MFKKILEKIKNIKIKMPKIETMKVKFPKVNFNSKITIVVMAIISLLIAGMAAFFMLNRGFMVSKTSQKVIAYANYYAPSESYIYKDKINPGSFRIVYDNSVAKMELVNQDINSGISIHPDIRGRWIFSGDRTIYFTPEKDWIPNTKYTVKTSKEIFSSEAIVKDNEFTFNSPEFRVSVESHDFYEDPTDTKKKQAVATFKFSYPIDMQNLKDYISVKTLGGDKYNFTIKVDDDYPNKIHILSDPVKIRKDEDFAEIRVSGVKNAYNGEKIKKDAVAKVKIPSSSTFFKINSINSNIVKNENKNNESEQILFINFSTAVDNKELSGYADFYYKKDRCYNFREKLKKAEDPTDIQGVIKLDTQALTEEASKTHMYKYDIIDRDTCVVVRVRKGLGSKDGFMLSNDEVVTLDSANYPMEAKIAFEGSILSLKGDKNLALSSRGVDKLDVEVARIDSSNINHLVSQTSGDFSHPYFVNYNFDESNISEIFEKKLNINMTHPAKLNYSSVNLNEYFKNKRGIFLVKVKGSYRNSNQTSRDNRLVVITDMGIIVKNNLDKTHDVFVSSFSEGTPVEGAKVEILGKNGIPILESYTNPAGMATFPNYSDFKKDKEPTAYLVTKGNDVSYMPIDKSDRRMDFSRFDVEGIYSSTEDKKIIGYAFTDRGIYRPGETAAFGMIIRNGDLAAANKLPLKLIVRNSNGDEVANKKVISNEYGFMDFKYKIGRTSPVGIYTLNIYDDSKSYAQFVTSVDFKVEEFTPDNMKIKLSLADVKTKGWYKLPSLKAEVNLQNLYGNPAAGHDVKANISLNPITFSFKQFSGYNFRDPLRESSGSYIRSYNENLDKKQTDEKGNVIFEVDLNQFNKGTYSLNVGVEGYELDSGRSVFTSSSALISPLDYIVGYKADGSLGRISKGSTRSVNFIAVDNELNKLEKKGLTIEYVAIKYVPSLMQMPNGTYKYQTVTKNELIKKDTFLITEAGTKYNLDTTTPGSYDVIVRDEEGQIISRFGYSVAGSENTNFLLDKDASLSVTLDKKEYDQGEEISLKIASPYEGYGLITIERDKTYNYKWFKTSSKTTTQTIRLPYTVEGNAYINVAFIRGINSKEIFIPPLSYAVVPFGINKEKRSVKIELNTPEVVKPGEDLVVKYKANKSGKIIVYGINQGILQVAKYQRPDPLSAFMKKKALRVSSYQIMDLIMPEMNLVLNHKAAGGDEELDEAALKAQINPFARKQDEVVAFWSGVIDVSEEYQEYRYRVPEIFNGQIKVMAVAVSETSFGAQDQNVLIRGDFALVPNGPFNVIPGDVFEVGTSVANLVEDSGDDYEVKLTLDADEGLEVIGDKEVILKLKEKGEQSVRFKVKALNRLGSSTLRYKAVAVNDPSKNFNMPYHIGVRPATPFVTALAMGYEPSKVKLKDFVIPMFNEYRRQEVLSSTSPLVLAEGLIRFLDKFPHSCSEQTISKVYPAMVMLFKHPELVEGINVYGLFDDAIAKLSDRQKIDGGFSGWGGSYGSSNEYVSLYAYDFLSQANEFDFNVPKSMLTKATNYAKSVAGRDISGMNDTNVAYAIYLLTRNGEVTTNYLINAEQYLDENHKKEWKKTLTSAYMAASYKLLKNETKARALLGKYKLGSDNIEDSRYIYLMAKYFEDDFKALGEKSVQALLTPLKKANFTTNSAAYALLALEAYSMEKDKNIEFVGKEPVYDPFARVGVSAEDKVLEIKSPNPFFYVVSEQGFGSDSVRKAKSNFVEISKEYLDSNGKVIEKAKVGDEITVRIRVRSLNKDYINDIAITDLTPGCFEMITDSISASGYLDNKEEREDRALIYLTAEKSTSTITYRVKAIAKGEFVAPAVFAEALYDSDVKANSKSSTFTVEE